VSNPQSAPGRPPATSRAHVAHVALELFAARGYEATTLDDVAAAVGVSRRTLFRYYDSKPDMVWADFTIVLDALRRNLEASELDEPWLDALRRAIVASNRYEDAELDTLRIRMRLITTIPALQAYSMVRYREWRAIVAEFVAERRGEAPGDFLPRTVGMATLATTMSAFEWWIDHESERDPADVIERALSVLATGFGT
jgi:TetR/AcrR family transcriptional regulator, regulator of mycofactocin system